MCTQRLLKRTPSAKFICVAILKKHEIKFHKTGQDGSGKCDAFCTGNHDDEVIGVVFDISEEDKIKLDGIEGGYQTKNVSLTTSDGKNIKAFTYMAVAKYIDLLLKPEASYKQYVLDGSKEHMLPDTYIQKLESFESKPDLV